MKKSIFLIVTLFATFLMANDGAALYKKCIGCHGVKAEKKALNKSAVIQGWDKVTLAKALKGYQDGSYGSTMKALMKNQIKDYDDAKIEIVSEYISTLK
ncbi:c-type cytochrome [Sulfurospirillum arcachonense]|uniref:c-type cytochrome n=1 Tax=Sulfurospirillum arcachonense TaxID=57666 RepID=UPI00046A2D23|nr:c-type cytochrome [Sulfurospirillum arcachonense]